MLVKAATAIVAGNAAALKPTALKAGGFLPHKWAQTVALHRSRNS
jgi:hypothetical protein